MEGEPEPDPRADLVGRIAQDGLLEPDAMFRPTSLGQPPAPPELPARRAIVAGGAALTGVSLLAGIVLIAWSLVASFTDGADLARGVLLALGIVLVATHWGWVHVAEVSARGLARHRGRDALERRRQWLAAVEPYAREEVLTEVEPDGALAILTVLFRPVADAEGRFSFEREEVGRELHPEETPAAVVAERVEELRHAAAAFTSREREHFAALAGAEEFRALAGADERVRLAERHATTRALSEQLNAHLREPPLEP